jgi:alkanesulfonate monooxygenase
MNSRSLRFHWRLPHGGETTSTPLSAQTRSTAIGLPDLERQIDFCRQAEQCGIDSLLTDFGFAKPDPLILATALGMATERIKLIIAYRSGLLSPVSFVQQINTLSALINGRLSLNIVAGYSPAEQHGYGDFLSHDERYKRTDEFLSVCLSFWKKKDPVTFNGNYYKLENGRISTPFISPERPAPEIFIAGSSAAARQLAQQRATCWLRFADTPERIRSESLGISERGIDIGVRLSVITRSSRAEALRAAAAVIATHKQNGEEKHFVHHTDSWSMQTTYDLAKDEWLNDYLWTGAVRYIGPTALALVGTPEEVASAVMEYRKVGVTQFILSGWPKLDEMLRFGRDVLPLIRNKEVDDKWNSRAVSCH